MQMNFTLWLIARLGKIKILSIKNKKGFSKIDKNSFFDPDNAY